MTTNDLLLISICIFGLFPVPIYATHGHHRTPIDTFCTTLHRYHGCRDQHVKHLCPTCNTHVLKCLHCLNQNSPAPHCPSRACSSPEEVCAVSQTISATLQTKYHFDCIDKKKCSIFQAANHAISGASSLHGTGGCCHSDYCNKNYSSVAVTNNFQCRDINPNACSQLYADDPTICRNQTIARQYCCQTCTKNACDDVDSDVCSKLTQVFQYYNMCDDPCISGLCKRTCSVCINKANVTPPPQQHGSPTSVAGTIHTTIPPAMCISRWSTWIDRDHPNSDGMEREFMQYIEKMRFCIYGKITRIECLSADGGDIPYYSSGEIGTTCDVATGLTCLNVNNYPVPCNDYKVRYYCDCAANYPTPASSQGSTSHATTSPPSNHQTSASHAAQPSTVPQASKQATTPNPNPSNNVPATTAAVTTSTSASRAAQPSTVAQASHQATTPNPNPSNNVSATSAAVTTSSSSSGGSSTTHTCNLIKTKNCTLDFDWICGKCYFFSRQPETWQDAQNICNALDGYLIELETIEEKSYLKDHLFQKHHYDRHYVFWLGGKRNPNNWTWQTSATPVNNIVWGQGGNPDSRSGTNCLEYGPMWDYKMNNAVCDRASHFICEHIL